MWGGTELVVVVSQLVPLSVPSSHEYSGVTSWAEDELANTNEDANTAATTSTTASRLDTTLLGRRPAAARFGSQRAQARSDVGSWSSHGFGSPFWFAADNCLYLGH